MIHGTVIAIGGNEDKRGARAILRDFVARAGGAEARIVVIPSASVSPEARAARYASIFRQLGAESVRAVHVERDITPDDLMLIMNASGIFVTGGDQERLMEYLRRTRAGEAIVKAVRSGAVYAGTSAGAAVVSARMIAGSTMLRGREVVEFAEGLGLVRDVIVDQHFSERKRLPRLITAVRTHGLAGVGIDEDTAIIWEPGRDPVVAGKGEVTFVQPEQESIRLHTLASAS